MRRTAFAVAVLAQPGAQALLAAPVNCADSTDSTACRLGQFLSWLHFAAGTLAVLLVAVLLVVLRIVRRNRRSQDPLARLERNPRRQASSAGQHDEGNPQAPRKDSAE